MSTTQPNGNGNGRADFYLKIIGVLICLILSLLTWVTANAIGKNETSHIEIKQMITAMAGANGERIKCLDERITEYMQHAPPLHIHHADGGMSRVIKPK